MNLTIEQIVKLLVSMKSHAQTSSALLEPTSAFDRTSVPLRALFDYCRNELDPTMSEVDFNLLLDRNGL